MPWKCDGLWGMRAGSRWPHLRHPYGEKDYLPYPFFLGYATALLEQNGFDAELLDAISEQIEVCDFVSIIREKDPSLIAAEVSTPSLNYDLELLKNLHKIAPVAICGPESNVRDLKFLEDKPFIDYVMVGEYEETLLDLVKCIDSNGDFSKVKGLIYRKNGILNKNKMRPLIKDLDSLPWPTRKGLQMQNYVDSPGGMPLPCAQMWASRGCPYKCIFCLWPHIMYRGNTYRIRNPIKVVDEMEYLIKELQFKSIYIDDDTANVNKKFLMDIATEIKKRGLRFPWAIMARPDLMDKDLLTKLRSGGLYAVKYGVESGVQVILDNANKNMHLEKAISMIKLTNTLGIKTHLTFTFGLPGESKESIEKTIMLALDLNPYSVQFSITTPFPGTSYFESLTKSGWKGPDDWGLFDGHKAAIIDFKDISSQYLEESLNSAYMRWFKYKNKLLAEKSAIQEIKPFFGYAKLYGFKFAFAKKRSYLNIKRQVIKENDSNENPQAVRKRNELLKGILRGTTAFCGPKTAVIDITNRCNLSCVGCWLYSPYLGNDNEDKKLLEKTLDFNSIKKIVDELSKLGVEEIQVSGGGEPLMHSEFISIIKYIKSKDINCNLITNFTLFNKTIIDNLIKIGLNDITISLWAGDAQAYSKTHPGTAKNIFDEIEKNINYLIFSRINKTPQIKIYNVISKENYLNIPSMLDFALKTAVDSIEFQLMSPIEQKTEHLLIGKEEAIQIKEMFNKFKENKEYVSEFISEADLLYYENKEHKKELSDFGRFIKNKKAGFQLINGLRIAKCPKGTYSIKREAIPEINVKNVKFFFSQETCQQCNLYKDCYNKNNEYPLEVSLLTVLGIGTFLRRVDSITEEKNSLDGKFIDSLPCYTGWYFTRINIDGDVKPCCKAENLILGNIKEKKFSQIWFSSSYDTFRYKSKYFEKSDSYFDAINCYKVCDNLGMNLVLHKNILEHTKSQKPKKLAYTEVTYNKNKIIIPSQSFIRGNLNRSGCIFGENITIDGGAGFGFAEYEFKVETPAIYELWSRYAAEIPRPIEIKIDARNFDKIMKNSTGGWTKKNLKLFHEIDIYLEKGLHKIELFSPLYFPHFERLELKLQAKKFLQGDFCDPANIYTKREPLKIFRESFKVHGLKFTLKRTLNYLKPKNFISNYSDIVGIFNKSIAYKGPFHVQIDLTNSCNNDCIGCWCNSPLLEEKKMSLEAKEQILPLDVVCDLLDEIKALGAKEVYYSGGGEPFTHPEIIKILSYTKKLGLTCYVNTNFTLLTKHIIDKIIDIGVDHLTVSIWAGTAQTYVKTHPNKTEATFNQIKENLTYLNKRKNEKPYIKLYEVIFNLNYKEIKQMIEFARDSLCESVEFTLIDTMPGKTDKLALDSKERDKIYNNCIEIKKEMLPNFDYKGIHLFRFDQFLRRISDEKDVFNAKYDKNIIDSLPCYIGWLFARILPDGNVNSCLKSHRFPVGNLFEKSFSEIWNSTKQQHFRKNTLCLKKDSQFFKLIGNDPDTEESGCYKSCDDIGRNIHMHKKIMSLTKIELFFLKIFSEYKSLKRKIINKNNPLPLLYKKKLPRLSDKIRLGIMDSRNAYQGPEHVVIDLTNKCQLKCIGCWLYSPLLKDHKPTVELLSEEIHFDKAKNLIYEISKLGIKIIRFTGGGEPLLYKGIFELLEITKSKGIKTCLTTNLYNLKNPQINALKKLKIDEIAVSLWAGDPETYISMHPGTKREDFQLIQEHLIELNNHRNKSSKVTIANVINSKNCNNVFEMAEFARSVSADAIYYTLVDTFINETDSLLLNDEQIKTVKLDFKKVINLMKESDIEIENAVGFLERLDAKIQEGRYDLERIDRIPCYIGWFFARILSNGGIIPCCRGVDYVMGNINKNSFSEIWFSNQYNGFRSKAKTLKKNHPYFKKMSCYKECDNYMHNEQMHRRVQCIRSK